MLEQQEGQQIQQAEPQGQPPVKKGGAHVVRSGKGLFAKKKAAKEEKPDPQKAPGEKQPKKKKKLSRKARIAIGAGVGAVVLAAGITAGVLAYQAAVRAEQANTSVACYGTIETFFEGSGVTAARVREELGLDVRGTVTDVLVEPGDEVQAGDDLILIDPTETREELADAQSELSSAQSAESAAQSTLTSAQSTLSTAQARLNRQNITAPFSGKMIPAEGGSLHVGQQLGQGEIVGYMIDDSMMKLTLEFSTTYSGSIQSGQSATVSIPSAMSEVSGTVSSVDTTERVSADGLPVFRVVISVDNSSGTLTKGMSATASVSAGSAGTVYPADAGTLAYNREEAVTAPVSGQIESINGIDYQSYSSGATIIRLSSDEIQDEISNAQNAVAAARSSVAAAQSEVAEKQSRIAELTALIQDASIQSTIDGVVVALNAEPDQTITGLEPLIVVADLNDIIVNADIPSTDIGTIEPGQLMQGTMHAGDGSELELTGEVETVALEPTPDVMQDGVPTFRVTIGIDSLGGWAVQSGMVVDYHITTESSEDCLMVPTRAIVETEEGPAVFALPLEDEDGEEIPFDQTLIPPEGMENVPQKYHLVPVETGISDGTNTEILWGIDEGTIVYLAMPAEEEEPQEDEAADEEDADLSEEEEMPSDEEEWLDESDEFDSFDEFDEFDDTFEDDEFYDSFEDEDSMFDDALFSEDDWDDDIWGEAVG